jgi:uncharacterized protein YcaQ
MPHITLDALRRFAVARTLFTPVSLQEAIDRFGFVQADPIRAPARAQDLILRHRVNGYRAGDLERLYASLAVEEDFFVNYGFLSRGVQRLMHPRSSLVRWSRQRTARARDLLAFVEQRGIVHPREVDAHFAHGSVTNYWGGASSATTHLLDAMHYRGWLRVARREAGIRLYAAHAHDAPPLTAAERRARLDALVDVVVGIYAPLPALSLSGVVSRLRFAVPQWQAEVRSALQRARDRLTSASVEGVSYFWPAGERAEDAEVAESVRFLAPFDPLVWDRRRFELFWGWAYRFEAYTPAAKRQLGYYALPLLWRDRVVGWANVSTAGGAPNTELGYVTSRPRERGFKRELDAEIERLRVFLG